MIYNYTIVFKIKNEPQYRYKMILQIEADNNKDALKEGAKRWTEQQQQRSRLLNANVIKIICVSASYSTQAPNVSAIALAGA